MEQINTMTIGKKIVALRKEAGLTQEQLAEKLGISPQAVSKWENDISCPDISTLPLLASLFNVTVDDLLGIDRPPEAELPQGQNKQDAFDENAEQDTFCASQCREEAEEKHGRQGLHGLGFALLLIGLGALFLLCRYFGLTPSVWDIVWPAVVLGLGVAWFVQEIAPLGLGVAFVGFYYLLHNLGQPLPFALDWNLIWPIGLVLLGLTILIGRFRCRSRWRENRPRCCKNRAESIEYSEEEGFLDVHATFAEATRRIKSEKLNGGDLNLVFAGGEMDLSQVKSLGEKGAAVLNVHVVLAGCSIYLPPYIRVDNRASCTMGGVDIHGAPSNPTATLTITGNVVLGGIDIRYAG
ncbi:MAG: helix-turn-helix domain-containing protein [Candidatus Pelethousia sp.]|nr:helix-turn-helix domain-containing protein [Candidatus Pelethousia sp.]